MSAVVDTQIKPFHEAQRFTLFCGDCRSVLLALETASVDSIVCDPPYELGFMGKGWDRSGIAYDVEVWRECLRVLKPGGHLLAFGGSRTYHRLACAIEDAGFEIRDQIQWIYGSGFPKSLDVSKAIDTAAGAERAVGRLRSDGVATSGISTKRDSKNEGIWVKEFAETLPATVAARQWNGWGTALKPAHEPIVLARKPLIGTVAENVLQHGTGGLNIDGCRIATNELTPRNNKIGDNGWKNSSGGYIEPSPLGRWPSNIILDGSDEVLAGFPDAAQQCGSPKTTTHDAGMFGIGTPGRIYRDATESAARFFYCAKASQEDRSEGCEDLPHRVADETHKRPRTELDDPRRHGVTPRQNNHPTVKPTQLMQYLCRLITPPGGIVLDPFCGSGSTGKGAMLEGFRFIGIEQSADYCELAQRRIDAVTKQGMLFT